MLLQDLRVLDLTDDRGELGPWLLAWLGAEVVKVEPPGGSAARLAPPTAGGDSMQFAAYNNAKSSVVIDMTTASGRDELLELVAGADIVFESGPPAATTAAGIGEDDLAAANDRFVHVLVTPFGASGPRADQPYSELTIAALGGPMSLQGVRERPPVKVSVPQVWRHAGTEAVVAALIAHRRMEQTGEIQWVDVSAQEVMTWTMLNAMEADEVQGYDFERAGLTVQLSVDLYLGHQAKDGVSCQVPIGVTCGPIMPWLIEEGIAPPSWAEQDWPTYDHRALSGEDVDPSYADLTDAIDELCSRYTRHELLVKGLEYGAAFAPVNTVVDLLAFDHLQRRSFWDHDPNLPGGGPDGVRRPGGPITVNGSSLSLDPTVEAPDQSGDRLRAQPRRRRRAPTLAAVEDALPLDGVKVADFSWIGVGPISGRALADHGATVVRVETEKRLDTLRAQAPFKDGEFGINRSNFFGSFNTSKMSLALDLTNPSGLDVARRLTDWADVVIDSFRPGTMEKLGLGADAIHETNPGAVVITTSLLGGGGPLSPLAGYGFHAGAIAGFTELVGWPDLGPDGPWMAYTDTIGPRFVVSSVLAALDHRDRTGHGCAIEAAQLEMGLEYLAPEVLEHQATGHVPGRIANRDPNLAPQGVYPAAGDDEWVAVTVPDDGAWAALCGVIDRPDWAGDPDLADAAGRARRHDELDDGIAAWTATRDPREAEAAFLAAGVPAGMVQRSRDLRVDPQYLHRGFYHHLEHSEVGTIPYAGHQFRIRGHDHGPRSAAPMLGEHSFEVLSELLGLDADEIAEIAASGALE